MLADAAHARVDEAGRIVVCRDLTLPRHAERVRDRRHGRRDGVPGVAPAAMQQGRHAARVIRARLAEPASRRARFRYLDKGRLAVIGRSRAVGTAFGIRFTARLALLIWAVVTSVTSRCNRSSPSPLAVDDARARPRPAGHPGHSASHGSLKAPPYNTAVNI